MNTEVNTGDNTDVNTEVNTGDNTATNVDANTDVNTADNAAENTEANTEANTGENTSDNTADNTEHPQIWVNPSDIENGDDVDINGDGFTEGGSVNIGIRELPDGDIEVIAENISVDEDGEFFENIAIEGYDPGSYQVVVTDNETGEQFRESLRINEAEWSGSIELAPAAIEMGGNTAVYGEDFSPSENAVITLEPRFESGEVLTVAEDVAIDENGSLTHVIDTSDYEDELQAGNYRVVVTDTATGNTSAETLVINGPERKVVIRLTPSLIQEGAENIRIVGEGYTPNTDAIVYLKSLGEASGRNLFMMPADPGEQVATAAVTEQGEINYQLDTSELAISDYQVTVQDSENDQLADYETFTVAPFEDPTADNTDANTEVNTGDNTDVNTADNAAENTEANTEVNTADNAAENDADNTSENTADNQGDNTEVNTGENADVNTPDNTEVNTSENTADNAGADNAATNGAGSATGNTGDTASGNLGTDSGKQFGASGKFLANTGATVTASVVGAVLLLLLGTFLVARARKNTRTN